MIEAVVESWTEIRCPACVPLGWYSSRLLLKVVGVIEPQEAQIQIKCFMCKSIIGWTVGTPLLEVVETGRKNHKRQTAAFE